MIVAGIALSRRRVGGTSGAAFAVLTLGTAVGGLFIAWDMSRSAMMILPAFLLGIWLWEEWRTGEGVASPRDIGGRMLVFVLPVVLIGNLTVPAQHVLWSIDWPVEPIWVEVQKWSDPPRVFDAARHLRSAGAGRAGGCGRGLAGV